MYFNPYGAQAVKKERVKDALREAKRAQLIREARGSRNRQGPRLTVVSMLRSLLSMVSDRKTDEVPSRAPASPANPIWKRSGGG